MGYGQHPASDYMVSDGKQIFALSTLDIIIDIAGMYFRCRSLTNAKNLNITEEYGSGSLDPYALVNQEHAYSGSFTFASFLVDGTEAMTTKERLILRKTLLDQEDEGRAKYFNIYTFEVPGRASVFNREGANDLAESYVAGIDARERGEGTAGDQGLNFIEGLLNCKVTKFNRDYADKGTIVSSVDFKYMYAIPS